MPEQKEEASEQPIELCPESEQVIEEIKQLNNEYKLLITQKCRLVGQLQKVEEGIQKCLGGYEVLKKLYVKATEKQAGKNV